MTDELSIQQQRPSAVPYLGIGGLAGGAAGYFGLPKIDAVKKWMSEPAKYSSYEEILKEADDKFTKAVEAAEGDEKTLMEKAAEARKAGVDAGNKWESDLKAYQEANKAGGAAQLAADDELLKAKADAEKALEARRQELIKTEAENIRKAGVTVTTSGADPVKVRNLKNMIEKEVKAHENATKEFNTMLKEVAENRFTMVDGLENLKQQLASMQKAGASQADIDYVKAAIKDLQKEIAKSDKTLNTQLEQGIRQSFNFPGDKKAKEKAVKAKLKEVRNFLDDVVAERTHNGATIPTQSIINADIHALDAIKETKDKNLIDLAQRYKKNPADTAKTMQRTIAAEKMRLTKLQDFQKLYTDAVKAAPSGETQVVEQLKALFGLITKTKTTTITPESQALERMWAGLDKATQDNLIKILGNNNLDADGIAKAIESRTANIKALETTVANVESLQRQMVQYGGEGAYIKNGVLYGKDGKAAVLKMDEISLSAKEIEIPKNGKQVSLERQLALMGEPAETTKLTEEQILEKAKKAVDEKSATVLKEQKDAIADIERKIAEKQAALPKNAEKSAEQLAKEFTEKNGSKQDAINKATSGFKDDLAKLFEGKMGKGKLALAVGGAVAAGALLGLAFRPGAKEA